MTLAGHIFVYFSKSNFFAGAKFNNGLIRGGGGGGERGGMPPPLRGKKREIKSS